MVRTLTLAALVLAVSTTSGAARQTPPNPLGQPLLGANGFPREDAFIHIPLRPDDARYAALEGPRLEQWLMEVDAISLRDRDRGNVFWGRNVGTQGHVDAEDWLEGYFRR